VNFYRRWIKVEEYSQNTAVFGCEIGAHVLIRYTIGPSRYPSFRHLRGTPPKLQRRDPSIILVLYNVCRLGQGPSNFTDNRICPVVLCEYMVHSGLDPGSLTSFATVKSESDLFYFTVYSTREYEHSTYLQHDSPPLINLYVSIFKYLTNQQTLIRPPHSSLTPSPQKIPFGLYTGVEICMQRESPRSALHSARPAYILTPFQLSSIQNDKSPLPRISCAAPSPTCCTVLERHVGRRDSHHHTKSTHYFFPITTAESG
jgi:hypothetical protein